MSKTEFGVSFPGLSSAQLRDALAVGPAAEFIAGQELALELRPAPIGTRSLDPTVLVAITDAVSAVLGCVITGLFQLAAKSGVQPVPPSAAPVAPSGSVVVVTSDGARLEVPVGTPQEDVDRFVAKAAELASVAHIYVSGRA